jgi:hypothetical protein
MSKKTTDGQYYILSLKRSWSLMTDADRSMRMFSTTVKELVEKNDTDTWHNTPTPDYMDAYLNAKVLKDFLQKLITEPDEKVAEYLKKNKLEGLLLTKEELALLSALINNFEDAKEYINKVYGFSTILN